jgi:hypothetical protein
MYQFDLGEKGARVGEILDDLRGLKAAGFTVAHGSVRNAHDTSQFEIFQREIVPAAEAL